MEEKIYFVDIDLGILNDFKFQVLVILVNDEILFEIDEYFIVVLIFVLFMDGSIFISVVSLRFGYIRVNVII